MPSPKVFISYSHDSEDHKDWVRHLGEQLRANGVDATLDQWDLKQGQDSSKFMQTGIAEADRVLLVCTPDYVSKANSGIGGVGFERLIVTKDLVESIDTTKFLPLLRNNPKAETPDFLGPRIYVDFNEDEQFEVKIQELLRDLLDAPQHVKPELGTNPFSGERPDTASLVRRIVGTTGTARNGAPFLSQDWFHAVGLEARTKALASNVLGSMEVRFGLHETINKSQVELIDAVRRSEIKTFGWPIAVTLDNRPEYRPMPFQNGIKAEIALPSDETSGDLRSFDYWTLNSAGDFYLLQSLFEDRRARNKIFFNTRIVRVTEALLFASNLYSNLSVPAQTPVSFQLTHFGLKGRELGSSSPNRGLFETRHSAESQSVADLTTTVSGLRENIVQNVISLVSPLLMLFEFFELSDDVYEDIVQQFISGKVT